MNSSKNSLGSARFPGLNGLRAFAAVFVLVHHIEQSKFCNDLAPERWGMTRYLGLGENGVSFFFVLSGFLITYLLCSEKLRSGTVNLGRFYLRRALRIWPLYYLILGLGFFVLPHIPFMRVNGMPPVIDGDFSKKLLLYSVFSAHVSEHLYSTVIHAGVLWSLGVEEHFYFVWPLLIRPLRKVEKQLPCILILIISVNCALRNLPHAHRLLWFIPHFSSLSESISNYFFHFRIECMAIGGFGAWLVIKEHRLLRHTFTLASQLILLSTLAFLAWRGKHFTFFNEEIYSILFLLLILNVARNPGSLIKLRNPVFEFLGELSFGIYAFNWIGNTLAVNFLIRMHLIPRDPAWSDLVVYAGCFLCVGGLATLSYFFVEKPFLRLRETLDSNKRKNGASRLELEQRLYAGQRSGR